MRKREIKRISALVMTAAAAAFLAGCAAPEGNEEVLIKVSLSQAAQEPPSLAAEYFKEIVEERSGGSIRVDVFPDNQLGNERDVIEGIQLGTIEMAMTSVAPFSSFVPSINIFCLPFLWEDKEHMYAALDSQEIGMSYNTDCEAKGFHLMGYLDLGTRHIMTTKTEINSTTSMDKIAGNTYGSTSRTLFPVSPQATNSVAPYGGVTYPIARLMQTITPKWIGSIP